MRGRKPTPTHLKLIRGDPRNEGRGKLEAKAEREARRAPPTAPEPPPELTGDALEEWRRLVPLLVNSVGLAAVDRGVLASLCLAWGRLMQAERSLAELANLDPTFNGLMIRTKGGNMMPNPMIWIASAASREYHRLAGDLGMTPAARARIPPVEQEDDDPAEAYFR